MSAPRKQSALSEPQLIETAAPIESEGGEIISAQESAQSALEAPEISLEMPIEQGKRTLLVYWGEDRVIAPFGELHAGEIVAAPDYLVEPLMRTGSFAHRVDEPIDQDAIRHP